MSAKDLIQFHTEQLTKSEHVALKDMFKGEATAEQQITFINILINKLCRSQELAYLPGDFDGSAFIAGRQFVAKRLLYINKMPASEAPEVSNNDRHISSTSTPNRR